MSFLVRTPTFNVRQADTLRILLRLWQAQLLQDAIAGHKAKGEIDPVVLTEAVFNINDMFETYYAFVAAIIVKAKDSKDGRCEVVMRETQWAELWKLCYVTWNHDTPEGKQILADFDADLKDLQSIMDNPPLTKYDMLDAKTTTSGKTNSMLN
jgi:hypothetical protein